MRQNMRKIEVAMSTLQQRLGHPPTESEVAKMLKMTLVEYQEMLSDGGGHQLVYYEDFHDSENNDSFLDRHFVDEAGDPLNSLLESDFRQAVINAINALPEREKLLMGLYYEQELNLKEIGAVMGVSESRVSQLHTQAVTRLRASLREQAWTGQV
jgi:RNA polymerase sigma factor for flagellar operon FliA